MSATEELRALLDGRGVEYECDDVLVSPDAAYYVTKLRDQHMRWVYAEPPGSDLLVSYDFDIGARDAVRKTLGECDPTWVRWHKSLRHNEIKTVRDAVEQLMWEAIEFGGDMGPNGNVFEGVDEGDVLTSGCIDEWVERFEELGRGTCRNVDEVGLFKCSECGHFSAQKMVYRDGTPSDPRYCPWCGREVVA